LIWELAYTEISRTYGTFLPEQLLFFPGINSGVIRSAIRKADFSSHP